MVFNDTTSYDGLLQRCEVLCNLGIGGITGDTALLKLFTSYINSSNKKVASALMRVDKRWTFDDYNNTDFPRGVANLVLLQQDYTLPAATASGNAATLLGVVKIAVLDTNSTPLEHVLTLSDLPESELNNQFRSDTPGLPTYYKLVGNAIKMWPRPSATYCTMTNGLVVYFKRTPVPFATSGTDAIEPGFLSSYHPLLAYDASAQYLLPKENKLAISYVQLWNSGLEDLQTDYSNLNQDSKNQIRVIKRSSR